MKSQCSCRIAVCLQIIDSFQLFRKASCVEEYMCRSRYTFGIVLFFGTVVENLRICLEDVFHLITIIVFYDVVIILYDQQRASQILICRTINLICLRFVIGCYSGTLNIAISFLSTSGITLKFSMEHIAGVISPGPQRYSPSSVLRRFFAT